MLELLANTFVPNVGGVVDRKWYSATLEQFSNALLPIVVTLAGMTNFSKAVRLVHALESKVVNVSGKLISAKLVHPVNAYEPRVGPANIVNFGIPTLSLKAPLPKEHDTVTFLIPLFCLNASPPTLVIAAGVSKSSIIKLQYENAFAPIVPVTGIGARFNELQ